jgi:hypothetical protein
MWCSLASPFPCSFLFSHLPFPLKLAAKPCFVPSTSLLLSNYLFHLSCYKRFLHNFSNLRSTFVVVMFKFSIKCSWAHGKLFSTITTMSSSSIPLSMANKYSLVSLILSKFSYNGTFSFIVIKNSIFFRNKAFPVTSSTFTTTTLITGAKFFFKSVCARVERKQTHLTLRRHPTTNKTQPWWSQQEDIRRTTSNCKH